MIPLFGLFGWLSCTAPGSPDAEGTVALALRPGEVLLSDLARANARLRVEVLEPQSIETQALLPARITLDPRREARVSSLTAGIVDKIAVRPGDPVEAGTTLAVVLSPDLGEAIGAHLSARARLETARARRDRMVALGRDGFASESQRLDADAELTVAAADAEAAEERLRVFGMSPDRVKTGDGEHFSSRLSLRSPIAGQVLAVSASLGGSVSSGESLFHVGNIDEIWLIADVYEQNLASVAVGSAVSFTVGAYGEELFVGTIDAIGDWLDPVSRTAEVRVVVANADHRLKPNMFAKARLSLGTVPGVSGLVLPADAVQEVNGRPSVFVEEAPGRYLAHPVRTEALTDGRLRVLEGLEARSAVVLDGAFTLKSELGKSELEGE